MPDRPRNSSDPEPRKGAPLLDQSLSLPAFERMLAHPSFGMRHGKGTTGRLGKGFTSLRVATDLLHQVLQAEPI